jgi:hypothetical protein
MSASILFYHDQLPQQRCRASTMERGHNPHDRTRPKSFAS